MEMKKMEVSWCTKRVCRLVVMVKVVVMVNQQPASKVQANFILSLRTEHKARWCKMLLESLHCNSKLYPAALRRRM